jgi:glutathione synthase/RimK-type ligase-like ATP-grasp enzyme
MAQHRGERMSPTLVVVGNPGCRRVAFWGAAAERLGWPPTRLVAYADLLRGRTTLADHIQPGDVLRYETAADQWETFKLLLKHGAEPARRDGYPALTDEQVDALNYVRGLLIAPRQAYLGFVRLLRTLDADLAGRDIDRLHTAEEIAVCFDKERCQERLARARLPIPRRTNQVWSHWELWPLVRAQGRLMVKLANGSGGAGCIALHAHRGRLRALTTVAEVRADGDSRLYHSKRVRHLTDESEIAALVDRLAIEKIHVEAWLPKARWNGENFDLRVVTIGGEPRHAVARASRSVFTNLTLGNRRGDVQAIARRMGPAAWQELRDTAAGVARALPTSFTLGIDILVRPDWRRHAVLEVNAFGDLLLGALDRGEDTYTATLAAFQQRAARLRAARVNPPPPGAGGSSALAEAGTP